MKYYSGSSATSPASQPASLGWKQVFLAAKLWRWRWFVGLLQPNLDVTTSNCRGLSAKTESHKWSISAATVTIVIITVTGVIITVTIVITATVTIVITPVTVISPDITVIGSTAPVEE